jgi:beta-hydroxylase
MLGPGRRLPEHRGPNKGVLRYHLGLKVPAPDSCGIRVGGQTRHWREGEGLLFDDTLPHEAWNDGDQPRVVLLVDVIRPLRFPYSWINRAAFHGIARTSQVREVLDNQRRLDA